MARKSTGGSSKKLKIILVPQGARSRSVSPLPPVIIGEGADESPGDNWCAMCSDGHEILVVCDKCHSANCASCVPGLAKVSQQDLATYSYRCVGCTGRQNFFVGLSNQEGSPVFSNGMEIRSHNIQPSIQNRLRTPRLVIIEFILEGLPDVGTPGQMLYLSLAPNYIGKKTRLLHEKIRFDLKNDTAIRKHIKAVSERVKAMKKSTFDHAVFILHTHSDDTTGALFYTMCSDEEGTALSIDIKSFFDTIIGKDMGDYLKGMKFSSFFLLSCGAVVQVKEAQNGLKQVAKEFRFTDTLAFGAPKVIGHFISIWMLSYADKVIVNGMSSKSCISSLLYSSDIGRHTSILFLHNQDDQKNLNTLSVARFIWEHETQRPNTHTFPLNCPVCHKIQSWCPPNAIIRKDGSSFTLPCNTKKWERGHPIQCTGAFEVGARPPSTLVASPYVGGWYSYNLGESVDQDVVGSKAETMVEG